MTETVFLSLTIEEDEPQHYVAALMNMAEEVFKGADKSPAECVVAMMTAAVTMHRRYSPRPDDYQNMKRAFQCAVLSSSGWFPMERDRTEVE